MKFKIFLFYTLLMFCVVGSAKAQAPQDIWQEYLFLNPPFSELRNVYPVFEEPYYSLFFKEMKNKSLQPDELRWLLVDMIFRLPDDHESLFREFWSRLSLVATEDNMLSLLTLNDGKIDKLPVNLNWFVDDVVSSFLRKEMDSFSLREMGCRGPKRYQQMFLEKFFARSPSSNELVSAAIICDEYQELFLKKLLNHPSTSKNDLINVLSVIDKYPTLRDQYFSLLLMRVNELDFNDIYFIASECKVESYCSFFAQLKFSAVLERRLKLLEIMRKK